MTQAAVVFDPSRLVLELLREELSPRSSAHPDDGPELPRQLWDRSLYEPLLEFLRRPGKEFRGRLVEAGWLLGGGNGPLPEELPLLVELLHAGSLIVDDIQDESTYRRGEPALHCLYGIPVALNAANWLYFWPYKLVNRLGLSASQQLALHQSMTETLLRCHQGQALDLTLRMGELAQREVFPAVERTTRLKTGALMAFAASLGGLAAGADPQRVSSLAHFGMELGVGLQMLDDLGGIVSDRRCHKGHEDLVHGRPTWPWAWVSRELDEVSFAHLGMLAREVQNRDLHPEVLSQRLAGLVGANGRANIRAHLERCQDVLERELGRSQLTAFLRRELQRLEASYD